MPAGTPIKSELLEGVGSAMVYTEWIIEMPDSVASHFNNVGATASGLRNGEFVPFEATSYVGLSLPLEPLPAAAGIQRYARLRVVVDDELSFTLGEYPRFPSYSPRDLGRFRGGPTLVPVRRFPPGFFGQYHRVQLYDGEHLIFGPADRFFCDRDSGVLYRDLKDGEGMLVAEVRNLDLLSLTGHGVNPKPLIPILTDPVFGEPLGATEILPDGERHRLPYQLVGKDCIGDTLIFNEGILWDVQPTPGEARIEIEFPAAGTGFACILWGGYSEAAACRADATVSARR